ncbi:hypothetical protein CFAM422_001936 [Trichoderma lentiforme]|uniref:Uncharacterized protein n=1 Tax=Trichoderma lentiforme TaxID=1567552 RepID=A0A9P4XKD0_9HYPO|nr:hypothetical protein CFAM422_001936 [Trichoderma lentiforme]
MEDARPKAYATRFFHARIHNRDLLQAKDKRKSYDYEQQLLYKIKAAGRASVDKSHMRMAKEREGEAKRGEAELQVRAPIDLRALPGAKLVDGGERSTDLDDGQGSRQRIGSSTGCEDFVFVKLLLGFDIQLLYDPI